MSIKLYSWPRSSGTRIAWALEELELPYEYVQLDASKQEHRAPQYLAIHPQGKVPALVDGDLRLFESAAILLHLGGRYGVERKLWPSGPGQDAADAMCWTVWAMSELVSHLMQYAYHGLDTPFSYKPADRSAAAAEYSRSQLMRCLDALEGRLEGRDFLLGAFTLADVAPASLVRLGRMFGIKVDTHPRVAAWVERCESRPALGRAR